MRSHDVKQMFLQMSRLRVTAVTGLARPSSHDGTCHPICAHF